MNKEIVNIHKISNFSFFKTDKKLKSNKNTLLFVGSIIAIIIYISTTSFFFSKQVEKVYTSNHDIEQTILEDDKLKKFIRENDIPNSIATLKKMSDEKNYLASLYIARFLELNIIKNSNIKNIQNDSIYSFPMPLDKKTLDQIKNIYESSWNKNHEYNMQYIDKISNSLIAKIGIMNPFIHIKIENLRKTNQYQYQNSLKMHYEIEHPEEFLNTLKEQWKNGNFSQKPYDVYFHTEKDS